MRAAHRTRRGGGVLFHLLLFLAVVGALGAFAWMLLLPEFVTRQIQSRTGFDATVSSLSCNPFMGRLTIRGLVLTNPASFTTGDFLQLREFRAVGDVWSLVSDRVSLDELTLDLRRVALVRRADGRSNADLFAQNLGFAPAPAAAPVAALPQKPPVAPATSNGAPPPAKSFRIRHLAIRVDQLVLADYSGAAPDVKQYDLAVNQHYENVTEPRQILVPEVLRRVAAENLGPILARLVPGDLGRALGDSARAVARSGEALIKDAGTQATDLLHGLREKLEQSKKP